MILFHGTSDIHIESIKNNGLNMNTWLALNDWHALQLANRTSKRDGGVPIILKINVSNADRVIGRIKPSFKYIGGDYEILSILRVISEEFK